MKLITHDGFNNDKELLVGLDFQFDLSFKIMSHNTLSWQTIVAKYRNVFLAELIISNVNDDSWGTMHDEFNLIILHYFPCCTNVENYNSVKL